MNVFRLTLLFAVLSIATVVPAHAQLAAPNSAGVTMGHVHLIVEDIAVQQKFWVDMMGGVAVHNGKLPMVQFPGVFVVFTKGVPTATSKGAIADHFGFAVKDLSAYMAKWEAGHLRIDHAENPKAGYVYTPDGMRVEFFEDAALPVPIIMNHIHFFSNAVPEMKAWYVKTFAARPGTRACVSCVKVPRTFQTGDLPGVNLTFGEAEQATAATKGRGLDHIGFEIKDLNAFVEKLKAQGIKMDEEVRASQNSAKLHVAYLTDPWGTRIELTEGLAP